MSESIPKVMTAPSVPPETTELILISTNVAKDDSLLPPEATESISKVTAAHLLTREASMPNLIRLSNVMRDDSVPPSKATGSILSEATGPTPPAEVTLSKNMTSETSCGATEVDT